MSELVEYLVKELVDCPQEVKVTEENDVVKVSVAKSDMGKIIGRQGRIAKSIRAIVKAAAAKLGKKCSVEIIEVE
ncbi:MAG: KH domain-containing protein [Clostridia bacterium]|nr:KH domain-containing protein [Clostridia bacterium]